MQDFIYTTLVISFAILVASTATHTIMKFLARRATGTKSMLAAIALPYLAYLTVLSFLTYLVLSNELILAIMITLVALLEWNMLHGIHRELKAKHLARKVYNTFR